MTRTWENKRKRSWGKTEHLQISVRHSLIDRNFDNCDAAPEEIYLALGTCKAPAPKRYQCGLVEKLREDETHPMRS